MANDAYIIRGGLAGRERLRVLSRVMEPLTLELFARVGVRSGDRCLDAGCGGVVCSAHEVEEINRVAPKDFVTMVPGIRPRGTPLDEQARAGWPTLTPID